MVVTMKMQHEHVKKYFAAWKAYDTELLQSIFMPSAKYIIQNKKRIYTGIQEIVQYWKRNEKRQKDIQLSWKTIKSEPFCETVDFLAEFWDIEECVFNKITGFIVFKFNSENKIEELSELYQKEVY